MKFEPGQVWMWCESSIHLLIQPLPDAVADYMTLEEGDVPWETYDLLQCARSRAIMHSKVFNHEERWTRLG